jgi:hypothetical protein
MTEYEITTLSLIVKPASAPIYSERATIIEMMDEAGGPFLEIRQHDRWAENGRITVDADEWPAIQKAVNLMFTECRNQERNSKRA